jgi:hypothetical protein
MSIFNDKSLKGVADAVTKIMDEELKGNQTKIDANHNGKIDAQDFKLLRAKKTMKEPVKEASNAAQQAAIAINMKKKGIKPKNEEVELDEAFPTVADAKKRMAAGKTATGTVTKTKTGLVHNRDYKDDDNDAEDMQKKSKGYGARQNFKRSTRVNEQKLSFTEMLQLYNEAGIEVINKIAPQTVKFGDTEVELIDANIVNGAVGITVAEEVDNETFTKEVEAQKEKNAGRGKKAEVAKPSVQAVKQEEVETPSIHVRSMYTKHYAKHGGTISKAKEASTKAYDAVEKMHGKEMRDKLQTFHRKNMNEETEQIDELSKDTLGSYIKKASHDVASKGAITRHFADKSRRETEEKKHDLAKDSMKRSDKVFASGWKRREGMAKAVDRLTKEDVQLDERTLTSSETSKKEEIVKSMKKGLSGFKQRYGDKAKSVMYATATKQAKKD